GNGNGSQSDDESGSRRIVHTARGCKYNEFLNFQLLNYKGIEGANSHVRTIGINAVNEMSWREIMKLITEAYCSRNEIQKLEGELWNLTVKGTNVVDYTQCFQELALLCPRMVSEEEHKVERYIWGLPNNIQENVTYDRSVRLKDAVKLANNLMDQKVCTYAAI
nr:hypothetical protein [Tanacetum cinerariifolium]